MCEGLGNSVAMTREVAWGGLVRLRGGHQGLCNSVVMTWVGSLCIRPGGAPRASGIAGMPRCRLHPGFPFFVSRFLLPSRLVRRRQVRESTLKSLLTAAPHVPQVGDAGRTTA